MASLENHAGRRRSILVVTDTPEDLHALQGQLGEAGYALAQTGSTEEAVERIDDEPPDLVLLDVDVSQTDGTAFCRRLHSRSETEAIPVIAIAEDRDTGQDETMLDIGADGVIVRPFEAAELLTRVRTLVRLKDLHDRVAEQNRQLLEVNAQLDQLNQELVARNRELEQGMAMAHRLQLALLPQQYPRLKNIAFSHKYTSAEAIGGDFFHIDGLDEERALIFISDVSGHGTHAALVASVVKTVIDYIDPADKTPTQVLTDFNSRFRSVLGPMTPQIYATGVLMLVDGAQRRVQVASAGHPSPLHVDKREMTAEPILHLDECGPAIGFLSDPDYPTVERELGVGDIVLGFTDGIYEVLNEREEMFGLARLQKLVADNAHLVPRDLIQRVITESEEFMGTHRRPDDICLVSFEVL